MQGSAISTASSRITAMLPADIVAAYVAITQAVSADLELRQPVLLCTLGMFAFGLPWYSRKFKGITTTRHLAGVTLSFVVWAYALGDAFQPGTWIAMDLHRPAIASVLLILWGVGAALFDNES